LQLGRPIAATSANISGLPPAIHHTEVKKYFGENVDFAIEGGFTKFKKESTIIDLTSEEPFIRRVGYITPETIAQEVGIKIRVL
jgi:L-threonylcarbamoyladenylate synthase